jgi:hypothetical protein
VGVAGAVVRPQLGEAADDPGTRRPAADSPSPQDAKFAASIVRVVNLFAAEVVELRKYGGEILTFAGIRVNLVQAVHHF